MTLDLWSFRFVGFVLGIVGFVDLLVQKLAKIVNRIKLSTYGFVNLNDEGKGKKEGWDFPLSFMLVKKLGKVMQSHWVFKTVQAFTYCPVAEITKPIRNFYLIITIFSKIF